MVEAYILIQTEVGKAANVATEIAQIKGVTLAEDVTGPYDVIVRAEARTMAGCVRSAATPASLSSAEGSPLSAARNTEAKDW